MSKVNVRGQITETTLQYIDIITKVPNLYLILNMWKFYEFSPVAIIKVSNVSLCLLQALSEW